jgi:hypothetical protein
MRTLLILILILIASTSFAFDVDSSLMQEKSCNCVDVPSKIGQYFEECAAATGYPPDIIRCKILENAEDCTYSMSLWVIRSEAWSYIESLPPAERRPFFLDHTNWTEHTRVTCPNSKDAKDCSIVRDCCDAGNKEFCEDVKQAETADPIHVVLHGLAGAVSAFLIGAALVGW